MFFCVLLVVVDAVMCRYGAAKQKEWAAAKS